MLWPTQNQLLRRPSFARGPSSELVAACDTAPEHRRAGIEEHAVVATQDGTLVYAYEVTILPARVSRSDTFRRLLAKTPAVQA